MTDFAAETKTNDKRENEWNTRRTATMPPPIVFLKGALDIHLLSNIPRRDIKQDGDLSVPTNERTCLRTRPRR